MTIDELIDNDDAAVKLLQIFRIMLCEFYCGIDRFFIHLSSRFCADWSVAVIWRLHSEAFPHGIGLLINTFSCPTESPRHSILSFHQSPDDVLNAPIEPELNETIIKNLIGCMEECLEISLARTKLFSKRVGDTHNAI